MVHVSKIYNHPRYIELTFSMHDPLSEQKPKDGLLLNKKAQNVSFTYKIMAKKHTISTLDDQNP